MAFDDNRQASSRPFRQSAFDSRRTPRIQPVRPPEEPPFDIFEWYPKFQSCYRYFLDQAQHSGPVQSLATFVNILLPCQKQTTSLISSDSSSPHSGPLGGMPQQPHQAGTFLSGQIQYNNNQTESLIPYIRRLVATGFDNPAVLHGFFGDDWVDGIGPLHETERRNYLFAAKSGSWLEVKNAYDMSPNESIPFMKPLQAATEKEILAAEANWSDWLLMQDWMVGPRALDAMETAQGESSAYIKRES